VLTGAPVAVAIAPHGYAAADTGLTTIGCGFDGSPESHEALAWAHGLARRRRAHLRALAIHTPIAFGSISTTGAIGYRHVPSLREARRWAADYRGGRRLPRCVSR